jgi:RNA polymerase sigma factor (TIGR02999 family)
MSMPPITELLERAATGDSGAADELLPLVYEELRKLAAARLAQEKPGQTLQATALVHEAYLRLVGDQEPARAANETAAPAAPQWNSRGHFFGAAAEAMRRILVEQARRKQAKKRSGERQRIDLIDAPAPDNESEVDLLALDEALTQLAATDARAADLVKLRYFAGLTSAQAAEALGISSRTADRTWLYARTWLLKKLQAG